jgi:hypothetical protein
MIASYLFGQTTNRSLRRPPPNPQFFRNLPPGTPQSSQIGNPRDIYHHFWPTKSLTLGTRQVQSSSYPLRNANAFLFGDRGDVGDHGVFEDTAGMKILFCEISMCPTNLSH